MYSRAELTTASHEAAVRGEAHVTHSGRPGLLERDDCILLVIDFQDPFLRKLGEERAAALVEHGRFVLETALGWDVPILVTVEAPDSNGMTTAPLAALLGDRRQWDKRVFGLCGQSDLLDAMLAQPRRTAVLIGMETDVCILHSAVGLLAHGFRSVIVRDAVSSPEDTHAHGLARAEVLGVELIHAKGLFYEWNRSLQGCIELSNVRKIAPPLGRLL